MLLWRLEVPHGDGGKVVVVVVSGGTGAGARARARTGAGRGGSCCCCIWRLLSGQVEGKLMVVNLILTTLTTSTVKGR